MFVWQFVSIYEELATFPGCPPEKKKNVEIVQHCDLHC